MGNDFAWTRHDRGRERAIDQMSRIIAGLGRKIFGVEVERISKYIWARRRGEEGVRFAVALGYAEEHHVGTGEVSKGKHASLDCR